MHTFTVHTDPGHGWVQVPFILLNELGISNKISRHSYAKGIFAYLEEDCDLATFVHAYREMYGTIPRFSERHTNGDSPIRGYKSYSIRGY